MNVHVVRFRHRDRIQWGVIHERRITPIPGEFATTGDFVRQVSPAALAGLHGDEVDAAALEARIESAGGASDLGVQKNRVVAEDREAG
jgi:Rv2993c-like, N-terminal